MDIIFLAFVAGCCIAGLWITRGM